MTDKERRIAIDKIHETIRTSAEEMAEIYKGMVNVEPYMNDILIVVSKIEDNPSFNRMFATNANSINSLAIVCVEMGYSPLDLNMAMGAYELRKKAGSGVTGKFVTKKFNPPNQQN